MHLQEPQSTPQPIPPEPAAIKSTRPKTTLNISGIFNKNGGGEKVQEIEVAVNQGRETIHPKQLREVWDEYAEQRRSQAAEYQILKREFEFENPAIQVTLNNPVEETLLENFRNDLVQLLRDKLKNSELTIQTVLKEASGKKIMYTSKEKFEHLAEKNPYLNELKDRLGLDWDY